MKYLFGLLILFALLIQISPSSGVEAGKPPKATPTPTITQPKYVINPYCFIPSNGVLEYEISTANMPANLSVTQWVAVVQAAVAEWDALPEIQVVYKGNTSLGPIGGDGHNVIAWSPEVVRYWFAQTFCSPGLGFDILISTTVAKDYPVIWDYSIWKPGMPTKAPCCITKYLEQIVRHEFGHTLGLDHADPVYGLSACYGELTGPIMCSWGQDLRRHVTFHDAAGVAAIY